MAEARSLTRLKPCRPPGICAALRTTTLIHTNCTILIRSQNYLFASLVCDELWLCLRLLEASGRCSFKM